MKATVIHLAPSSSDRRLSSKTNRLTRMTGLALRRWQNARERKRLRQELDGRVLADIGLTKLPTAMDNVSDVAVQLLGAPTYKEK